MRTLVLTIVLALGLACGSPTGNAPASIAGTWSDQASVTPDSVTVMTLSQSDSMVSGTVTIGGDTLGVNGVYHPPRIRLSYLGALTADQHGLEAGSIDGTALSPTTIQVVVGSGPTRRFIKQ